MAEDMTNIALSAHASEVANRMKESGYFEDALTAAKFAMSYAIKYYFDEIDCEELDKVYDANGNHYNVGSVDSDNYVSKLLTSLYPNLTTPYRYARVLMCYVLNKLGDIIEEGRLFPLSEHM